VGFNLGKFVIGLASGNVIDVAKQLLPKKIKEKLTSIGITDDTVKNAVGGIVADSLEELKVTQEFQVKMKELDLQAEEIYQKDDADRRALIKAEIQSEDVFVRRSRPTFLYIMYSVIVYSFILTPFLKIWISTVPLITLPHDMWWLFGAGFLGYGGFRTLDKAGGLGGLLGNGKNSNNKNSK